jgi:photosystem II CP47 chlorophyll apoprotein
MFGFGAFHVTGLFGPGIWVSDAYGITGKVQPVAPSWGRCFNPFNPGGIAAHHIAAGLYFCGCFPFNCSSTATIIRALRMGNIETVLSSSISAVFFAALLQVLCGAAATPLNYLVQLVTNGIVVISNKKSNDKLKHQYEGLSESQAWSRIPDKLAFYDILEITQLKVVYSVLVLWIKVMVLQKRG